MQNVWSGKLLKLKLFKAGEIFPCVLPPSSLSSDSEIVERKTRKVFQKTWRLKRLNLKELPSRPVGLSFHGLDALSLSLLEIEGTTAGKK